MKTIYGKDQPSFQLPDWPINYATVGPYYERAEVELGVAADAEEQSFCGISFSAGHTYPMPRIPPSLFDQRVGNALEQLTDEETKFLEVFKPVTGLRVRVPAGGSQFPAVSKSPRLRWQHQLHSNLSDPSQI